MSALLGGLAVLVQKPFLLGPVDDVSAEPGMQLGERTHPIRRTNAGIAEPEHDTLEEIEAAPRD
jgi:hypothetical protein